MESIQGFFLGAQVFGPFSISFFRLTTWNLLMLYDVLTNFEVLDFHGGPTALSIQRPRRLHI